MRLLKFVNGSSLSVLVCLLILIGCTPTEATPSSNLPENKLGLHLLLDDGRNHWPLDQWDGHIRAAAETIGSGGYIVQVIGSDKLDPDHWQPFLDLCAENDLIPIIRLATNYNRDADWWDIPQANPNGSYRRAANQYARFITRLDWHTDEHIILVGNEPNNGIEWGGQPDPAAYARFLIDVASAIHEADPQAIVLNAPLDLYAPNTNGLPFIDGRAYIDAESFMDGMITAEPDVFTHIDAWASHPYPVGPFSRPPYEQEMVFNLLNGASNPNHIDPPTGINNRGINGYEWELFKLSTYGVTGLDVYITETGWRHAETQDENSPDGGDSLPDVETLAAYIDLALWGNGGRYPDHPESSWTAWMADSRVVAVVFFAFDGVPSEWGHTNWVLLDEDGRITGDYPFADALIFSYDR